MKRAPDRAEVFAAELRFAQSAQATTSGVRRTRAALRETLARPSTIAGIAGAGLLAGFLLAGRKQRTRFSGRRRVEKAPSASPTALLMAFVMREGMRRLPLIIEQLWAKRQRSAPAAAPVTPPPGARSPGPAL